MRSKAWLALVLLLLISGAASAAARTAPAGKGLIVFSRADVSGRYGLFTISPSTKRLQRVTRACGWDWFPAWSPDGRRIAFARACGKNADLDLYVVEPNGNRLRRLVHTSTNEEWPTWSPDGSKIAFVSGEAQWTKPGEANDPELWVVGANGRA